jgi:hypothetical protein
MARLTRKQMADIIARDMPGYRIAEPEQMPATDAADLTRAKPEAATPDVEVLRRKYFGAQAGHPGGGGDTAAHQNDDDADEEIVQLVPKDGADPWDRARRPKSVVFSHKQRRVVGYQG